MMNTLQSVVAPLPGFAVSSYLNLRLGNQNWDPGRPPIFAEGYEGQIGAAGMEPFSCQAVLGEDLYADFHGCVTREVNRCQQYNELADLYRVVKVDLIYGRCDDRCSAVTLRCYGRCDIDQMHHPAAENVAERIGIVR